MLNKRADPGLKGAKKGLGGPAARLVSVKFNPAKAGASTPPVDEDDKNTQIEKTALALRPKKRAIMVQAPGEKAHKASSSKAVKKAARLKAELVSEEDLLESLPQLPEDSHEKQALDAYFHMFRRLNDLIANSEATCLKPGVNSREYYALCTLYSQQREVIADIRSISDMSGQVATMNSNVIEPIISSIGQNVLDSMFQIKRIVMECGDPSKVQLALLAIEKITMEQGVFLQHQYKSANQKVSTILLG